MVLKEDNGTEQILECPLRRSETADLAPLVLSEEEKKKKGGTEAGAWQEKEQLHPRVLNLPHDGEFLLLGFFVLEDPTNEKECDRHDGDGDDDPRRRSHLFNQIKYGSHYVPTFYDGIKRK
ncbi:MAG TPA: hypothetical protein VNL74_06455 [Methylococcus sp.]|nr:hypothetical protein [Methylococcus sp.]